MIHIGPLIYRVSKSDRIGLSHIEIDSWHEEEIFLTHVPVDRPNSKNIIIDYVYTYVGPTVANIIKNRSSNSWTRAKYNGIYFIVLEIFGVDRDEIVYLDNITNNKLDELRLRYDRVLLEVYFPPYITTIIDHRILKFPKYENTP